MEQLTVLPILLFSVVLHEVSHGWMALRLGDPTAKEAGRLTLNPLPHIDPFGSVIVPLLSVFSSSVFIAWAKPVPVNPANFSRPRRDDIFVSAIGPVSNILIAFACTGIVIALGAIMRLQSAPPDGEPGFLSFLRNMFAAGITMNLVLAIFNLLPVPPLDGSHVLAALLPAKMGMLYRKVGFYGIFLLVLVSNWAPFSRAFWSVIAVLRTPFEILIRQFG